MNTSGNSESLLHRFWGWSVVGTGFVFVYGAGLVALSLGQLNLATILMLIAVIGLTAKAFSSPEFKNWPLVCIVAGTMLSCLSMLWVQSRMNSVVDQHVSFPPPDRPQTPDITWTTPSAIEAGTPLSESATASFEGKPVRGRFVYNPALGSILPAGIETLSVAFYPSDANKFSPQTQTTILTVKTNGHQAKPAPPLIIGETQDALESGKPLLEILTDSINGEHHGHNHDAPEIPLDSVFPSSSFAIRAKNFGQRPAQRPALTGKFRFPDPRKGIDLRNEMKTECEYPSQFMGEGGPSVGPTETVLLLSSAKTDFRKRPIFAV